MKRPLATIILLLILLSCAKCSDDNNGFTNNHPELLATWKYVELIGFDYNCPTCGPYLISDGFTITFNSNGTFTSNEMADYPKGRYVVSSSDEITLTYRSATLSPITKVKRISSLTDNGLILEPIPICFEGCSERYEKITTP